MGTRGAYGFYRNGETKVTYNHYDSYPECLGEDVAKFVMETSVRELNNIFDRIILVDESSKPTHEQMALAIKYYDGSVSTGRADEWYALLRDSQGDLNVYKEGLPFMIDSQDFLKDSLFCEWAYIINLNTNVLEVYKGFQKEADRNRYYNSNLEDNKYKNVKLIDSIDFSQLDNFMNFVMSAIHGEED